MIDNMGTCSAKTSARTHAHTAFRWTHIHTYIHTLYVHIKIHQCIAYKEKKIIQLWQKSANLLLHSVKAWLRDTSKRVNWSSVLRCRSLYTCICGSYIYKILLLLNKTEKQTKKHLKSILHLLYSTVESGMYLSFEQKGELRKRWSTRPQSSVDR